MSKLGLAQNVVRRMIGFVRRTFGVIWAIIHYKFTDYSMGACLSQTPFILFCVLWGYWIYLALQVLTGFAIALLAVAAVVMTARGELTKPEKIIWVLIAFALFGLETASLYQDRKQAMQQQVDDRKEQDDHFEAVLRANKKDFDATMKRSEDIFKKTDQAANLAKEGIEGMTGADSYLTIIPHRSYPPKSDNEFGLVLGVLGKHTVWDGAVTMREGGFSTVESFSDPNIKRFPNLRPITKTHVDFLPDTLIHPKRGEVTLYGFAMTSRGIGDIESLSIRFNEDKKVWEFQYDLFSTPPMMKIKPYPLLKHQDWTPIPSPIVVSTRQQ
jgi:hypothetical protein